MKMKKILLLLLTTLLLVSCSSKEDEPQEPETPDVVTPLPEPDKEPEPEPEPEPEVKDPIYSRFTGLEISEDNLNVRPIMAMIDNHHDARNQANLSKASIIYEMRVEGPFTRYAAIFEKQDENLLIGPVRSARPNFVSLAIQYNVIYLHYGGSTDGLNMIYRNGVTSIEGDLTEGIVTFRYFDTGKFAPHNGYTVLDNVYDYVEVNGIDLEDTQTYFNFNTDFTPINQGDDVSHIQIVYDYYSNFIDYYYDEVNQNYTRYREGVQMVDETTGTPVTPTNVIIQIADSYIYDNIGHQAFNTTGEGTGYLLSGGKVVEITWSQTWDETSVTQYYYLDGTPITLNPGQTWINVVDSWMPLVFE